MKRIVLMLCFLVAFAFADLPSHCMNSQIMGKWVFKMTKPTYYKIPFGNNCGHKIPDATKSSFSSVHDSSLSFISSLNMELDRKGEATIKYDEEEIEYGRWTMVYDEGFEIRFNRRIFFTFSYYEADSQQAEKFEIDCAKTLVGWYKNEKDNLYGCFIGAKIENLHNSEIPDKLIVAEKKTYHARVETKDKIFLSSFERLRFVAKSTSGNKISLKSTFSNHELIQDRVNRNSNNKWKAGINSVFGNLTISELNVMAGRKKYFPEKVGHRFLEESSEFKSGSKLKEQDLHLLPSEFSWGKFLRDPETQSTCGCCYTISSLRMIEARLKIKYGGDYKLSVQHVLDCSFYNQGCDGGYPYLVGKFGNDFFFVPESCKKYEAKIGRCDQICDFSDTEYLVKTQEYYYVGGRYGVASERAIMEEVVKNGPVVISFEPDYLFMMYKSGIYHGVNENTWLKESEDPPEWTKVDHSVLLYGWGEENGEKYWLLQNSWGKGWGENGTFKMKRGSNEMGIESSVEAIKPELISDSQEIKALYEYTNSQMDIIKNEEPLF